MQIIKYKWINSEPFVFVKNNNSINTIGMFENTFNMSIGDRFCIGSFRNSKHNDCKKKEKMTSGYYCNECGIKDDYFGCIRCMGDECINIKQRISCMKNFYYIYLASFGPIIKVGISYDNRFQERLIEQGADFAAKLCMVKDGLIVRRIEQEIRTTLNIVDRVHGKEKMKNLISDPIVCIKNINNAIDMIKESGIKCDREIYDLRQNYRLDRILSKPKEIRIEKDTEIKGKFVSAKGNIVVYNNDSNFYCFNMHDAIGREINMLDI